MPKAAKRRLPSSYVAFWMSLMLVAVTYLFGVTVKPDLMAELFPPQPVKLAIVTGPEPEEKSRTADAQVLLSRLAAVERDREALRTELARRTDHEVQLTQRLAALQEQQNNAPPEPDLHLVSRSAGRETTVAKAEPAVPTPPQPVAVLPQPPVRPQTKAARLATTQNPARTLAPAPATTVQAAVPPAFKTTTRTARAAVAPTQRPALSAVEQLAERSQSGIAGTGGAPAPVAGGIVTGSVTPAPAAAAPLAGTVGINLGTAPSIDAVRMTWGLVSERYRTQLDRLEPRYMTSRSATSGQAYDLIAGPLKDSDARKICAELRAQKLACSLSTYGGNAL